jgi:hypothetical protein
MVFERMLLRRIFGTKREEVWEDGKDCIMRNFIASMLHQILLGSSSLRG